MNKLYKHLPHQLKRRVVKKKGEWAYQRFLGFHKLSIELAKAGHREIGLEWRKTPRERRVHIRGFNYSASIDGAFFWHHSIKGDVFWYRASMRLEDSRMMNESLAEILK